MHFVLEKKNAINSLICIKQGEPLKLQQFNFVLCYNNVITLYNVSVVFLKRSIDCLDLLRGNLPTIS